MRQQNEVQKCNKSTVRIKCNAIEGGNHWRTAVVAHRLMPHLFAPLLSCRKPLMPHLMPQLFLMIQQSSSFVPYPTRTSAWSGQVEHRRGLATPLLQCIIPVKSSRIDSGPISQTASLMMASSCVRFMQPLIFTFSFSSLAWQGPEQFALRGQSLSFINPPFLDSQSMALQGHPPAHPSLVLSQSISCCSDIVTNPKLLLRKQFRLSMLPAVLKVQQEPQLPWSFIGPTAPSCCQFQMSGVVDFGLQSESFVKFATKERVGLAGTLSPMKALASE